MTTFFLDLWHDLREKRLWPVAVGLLAAIVAVPVLVFKPASGEPAIDDGAVSGAAERLPVVNLEDGPTHGSQLGMFDAKDPFKPMLDAPSTPGAGGDSAGGSGGGDVPIGESVSSRLSGSDSSGGGSSSGGSSGGGGGSAGGGGGSAGGGGGGSVQYFTFTVDVKFGKRGDEKTHKGLRRLELLPDDDDPVVVFMGVTNDAKKAVFLLIDPGYDSDGEGECHGHDCEFVYLGLDDDEDEHTFATPDGGSEYNLQLLRINRENLSEDEALGDSQPSDDSNPPSGRRRPKRRSAATLFDVPLLSLRR